MLSVENFIGRWVSIVFIVLVFVASYVPMQNWLRLAIIALGAVPFVLGIGYTTKIEQVAGYYRCAKCGHKYIPEYNSVLFSMHFGRTRYMRCPKCHEKSWQKKLWKKIDMNSEMSKSTVS